MNSKTMKHKLAVLKLSTDGYFEPLQIKPHLLDAYAFTFLVEGEILADVSGQNILVSAGQFLLVPPGAKIIIKHFYNCQGYQGYFQGDALKDHSYAVLREQIPVQKSFWFEDAVFMGSLMKRMHQAFEDKDIRFLQSAIDLILTQVKPNDNKAIVSEKFLQMVFEKDQAPLSVAEYAGKLGVTPNYLNKTVKNHTHRTAIDWIEIARMNIAKRYLKDPSVPIIDVAIRCGLDDQSYFSRFFKKITGITPTQYRNGR